MLDEETNVSVVLVVMNRF